MRSESTKLVQSGLLLTILLLTGCGGGGVNSSASTQLPPAVVTSTGTDFFLTLPDHLCVSNAAMCNNTPVTNRLVIAAAVATTGVVSFNGVITPFSVAAGGETIVTLDPAVVLTSNETVETKGIHVTALAPVSVHVISENPTSAEGYLALPTAALGTNYYVMSFASARYSGSEFAVVATQNSTTVTITPTAAGSTRPAGTAFTVLLNIGETYQLSNPANADMTGTLVTSDKPIAAFGGHRCAEVPASGVGYCDYIVEQLPDASVWGKTYHTLPFSGRDRYTVRVLASQNGTTITTMPAGLVAATLNAGQFADVIMTGAGEFVSNNPVLVAQFMHGYADDVSAKGDPSMVLVTPTAVTQAEKGVTDSTFGVYGLAGTPGAFLNVVTETATLANMKLDNVAVNPALFTPIGGAGTYSAGTIPVTAGVHTLLGSAPYSAFVYDYGVASNAVSYAYPVGATLTLPVPVAVTPAPTPAPAPAPAPPPVNAPAPSSGPAPAACADDHETSETESHNDAENHNDHSSKHSSDTHEEDSHADHDDGPKCHHDASHTH
ncbi:MAG: hypothetical protein HY938_09900 [Nitrosomonadales bacterium]|nr:hypothetical protein [Nitrosomonadales bacterium]